MRFPTVRKLWAGAIVLGLHATGAGAMPSTAEFHNALTVCAAGSETRFDAELVGSIVDLYQGDRVSGQARLDSLTSFLQIMPESDRAAAYKIYVDCISNIVKEDPVLDEDAVAPPVITPGAGPTGQVSGSRSFRMVGGTTETITPDEVLVSMLGTPCAGRGDIVCVRIAGAGHKLGLGDQVNVPYSGGQCQLTLTEILKGENAARFHLRCIENIAQTPEGGAASTAGFGSKTFRMTGGATEAITGDEILLSMIGTPCAGRGDIVCVRLAGVGHNLGLGEQVDVAYSGGQCQLTLAEIFKGQNAARFHLRC